MVCGLIKTKQKKGEKKEKRINSMSGGDKRERDRGKLLVESGPAEQRSVNHMEVGKRCSEEH